MCELIHVCVLEGINTSVRVLVGIKTCVCVGRN